jgi:hypothetical protein
MLDPPKMTERNRLVITGDEFLDPEAPTTTTLMRAFVGWAMTGLTLL